MDDVLRIGIAGLGEATTEFLPDYVKHPKVKVTAAADFRQAALDRFKEEVKGKVYRTFEEICRCPASGIPRRVGRFDPSRWSG